MLDKKKFYINGEWVSPKKPNDFKVTDPSTEEECAVISLGGVEDVNDAVSAATKAFETWAFSTKEERLKYLEALYIVYKKRWADMAKAITLEMGAPIDFSTQLQAGTGASHIKSYIKVLKEYTFDSSSVTLLANPTKEMIINEMIKLQGELGENDNLLVYYSGHGINKNEVGYWLPSNAMLENRSNWLSNSEFRDYLNGIKTEHTLVIADACFSGSIFNGVFRDVESFPCEEMAKVKSRRAMTSGANTVVPDESVFLKYLCTILSKNEQSCLSAEELYSRIKPSVISNSPNNQIPQFGILPQVGDEGGNFVFRKR